MFISCLVRGMQGTGGGLYMEWGKDRWFNDTCTMVWRKEFRNGS